MVWAWYSLFYRRKTLLAYEQGTLADRIFDSELEQKKQEIFFALLAYIFSILLAHFNPMATNC
jgi:hypothetical protein